MKTTKTTILPLLILASSLMHGCRDPRNADLEMLVLQSTSRIIDTLVSDRESKGDQVNEMFIICNKSILIIDSNSGTNFYFDCSTFQDIETVDSIVERWPIFEAKIFGGHPMDYYFISFDTISIGDQFTTINATYGPFGTRLIYEFTILNSTNKIVRKKFREVIQE